MHRRSLILFGVPFLLLTCHRAKSDEYWNFRHRPTTLEQVGENCIGFASSYLLFSEQLFDPAFLRTYTSATAISTAADPIGLQIASLKTFEFEKGGNETSPSSDGPEPKTSMAMRRDFSSAGVVSLVLDLEMPSNTELRLGAANRLFNRGFEPISSSEGFELFRNSPITPGVPKAAYFRTLLGVSGDRTAFIEVDASGRVLALLVTVKNAPHT